MSKRLAMKFHEIYERLAPRFGYETRTETRAFDPTTPNGRLMIAVTDEIEDYHLDFNKALEEDYCALHQENDKLRAELAHLNAELETANKYIETLESEPIRSKSVVRRLRIQTGMKER